MDNKASVFFERKEFMTKAGDDGIQLGYKINRLSFTEMQGVAQAFIDRAVRVDSFFSNRDVDYISELEANDYNVFKCVSFVNDTNYIHVYAIISDLIGERIRVDLSICEEYINLYIYDKELIDLWYDDKLDGNVKVQNIDKFVLELLDDGLKHINQKNMFYRVLLRNKKSKRKTISKEPPHKLISLGLLEGMGVSNIDKVDLEKNWESSDVDKSVSVPIGFKDSGDIFYFDAKFDKDGANGLIVGRQGSGKTELLSTWILSMALKFSPDDVSFILFDCGEGISYDLKKLPHVCGSMYWVHIGDKSKQLQKAIRQIREEYVYRINVLEQHKCASIKEYHQLCKLKKELEPLPYLYIVFDDMVGLTGMEMVMRSSEYKILLGTFFSMFSASIAGRTGIQFICSTQNMWKLDEEFFVRYNYLWCMKTDSKTSQRVIDNSIAADIKHPGYFINRTSGFEQREELIRGFYTGKKFVISENGENKSVTEKDLIIKHIVEHSKKLSCLKRREVITDELPKKIYLPDILQEYSPDSSKECLNVAFGLADDIINRNKPLVSWDFIEKGHCGIYGSPMTGKTTLLQTIIMSAISTYSAEKLNLYAIDFGNWSLNVFQDTPHSKGIALDSEQEKINSIIDTIEGELEFRKQLFKDLSVSNIAAYNSTSSKSKDLPYIIILIDNLLAAYSSSEKLKLFLENITRMGQNYGIWVVYTASNDNLFKIGGNVKNRIVLNLRDESEYSSIMIRRCDIVPECEPGRGIIRWNDRVLEFQTALPAKGNSEKEIYMNLKDQISYINQKKNSLEIVSKVKRLQPEIDKLIELEYIKSVEQYVNNASVQKQSLLDTIDSYKKAGIKIPEYITNQLSEIEFVEKISGEEKKNYIVEKARREMNMLGSCHGIWATQKRILKERYNIDWLTPAEEHPEITFD